MHNPHDPRVLPLRDGVAPSCVVLPSRGGGLLVDFLTERLPLVARADWLRRMARAEVVSEHGTPASAQTPFTPGLRYYYYREVRGEAPIPFEAQVLYQDAHLLVADKPHFLPVMPGGCQLHETLLVRLKKTLDLPELSPVHRIDRDTAGLVLFSVQRATRGAYQALFRERAVTKVYEAIAPWRADLPLPRRLLGRLEESGDFFRMHEVAGTPNADAGLALIERLGAWARYRLTPVTGKRHQLRVQMAAIGLPLWGDALYPQVDDRLPGDYRRPLQLLAKELRFDDPLAGQARHFASRRVLRPLKRLEGAGDGAQECLVSAQRPCIPPGAYSKP